MSEWGWITCDVHGVDHPSDEECPVCDMRRSLEYAKQKPLRMLSDLYHRHMQAVRDDDEELRQRYFNLIAEFEWAFPDVASEHKELYGAAG